jgi:hypothetical protein
MLWWNTSSWRGQAWWRIEVDEKNCCKEIVVKTFQKPFVNENLGYRMEISADRNIKSSKSFGKK